MPDDDLREMSLDQARELAVTLSVEDLIDALCGTCVNGNRLPVRRVVIGRG